MKKKKLLRAMELADEKFVAEADPEKQFSGAKLENQSKTSKKPIRKWALIAACLALVLVTNLVLFIPYGTNPPSVKQYASSEYYDIIQKLNVITYRQPDYKNNFEVFSEGLLFVTGRGEAMDAVPESPSEAPIENGMPSDINSSYHETTDNQVAGVTEADRIKRSDKYIYYLSGYQLYIYSIEGEDSTLAGVYTISGFDSGYDNEWEFYLSRDCTTVTLVTPNYNSDLKTACTTLISLDVTNPAEITEKGRISVTGGHISTRIVNGKILLMTNFRVILNGGKVDFEDEFSFIPAINKGEGFEILPVDDIITPETLSSARYTVVCKLDEASLDFEDATALLSYSENVYVSADKIFAANVYTDTVSVDNGNAEVVKSMTDISAISYADVEMKHLGTATVEGFVKDQYSLDEHEGILRVVTTTDGTLQKASAYNNDFDTVTVELLGTSASLYCISLDSYKVISSVERFAPRGETVRSVRFDGDDAYVCTAVQLTDPVFFFDLSDVNNITYKETGTIAGFSTSLVNFGGGYLLGIGVGDSWGTLKIEVYEELEDTVGSVCWYELDASYSENYKSYYIDRENQLVGLGVTVNRYSAEKYGNESEGRYILVRFDGYKLREVLNVELDGMNEYKRGVLIDDYFYMLSGSELRVEKISASTSVTD